MSPRTATLACALTFAAVLSARADQVQVKLDADNGLWEVTTHGESSGAPVIPEAELQRLTPEQRARVQAAMQAALERAKEGRVMRECLTGERRARGFEIGNDEPSCKTTVVKNTSTELEIHKECGSDDDMRRLTERFQMSGRRRVTGSVELIQARGGGDLKMHTTFEGKWLGADCGGVKDVQVIK
jgi:hypothetical protein